MTPKEKAEDLISKHEECDEFQYLESYEAKACSLVTVNEILSTLDETVEYCLTDYELPIMRGYWLLVKLEIEKL
jgi:hypothetical protein